VTHVNSDPLSETQPH